MGNGLEELLIKCSLWLLPVNKITGVVGKIMPP